MQPGQVALLPVTFIEDRAGRALVRLPNGSKTTVGLEALAAQPARGHFVARDSGPGGVVHCLECDWSTDFSAWPDAVAELNAHAATAHVERG